jgi:hypothetical protein
MEPVVLGADKDYLSVKFFTWDKHTLFRRRLNEVNI